MESNVEIQNPAVSFDAMLGELRAIRDAVTIDPVPLEKRLWSAKEAADYLLLSERRFKSTVACKATFPRPLNISGSDYSTGLRWKATDVIAWALAQRS